MIDVWYNNNKQIIDDIINIIIRKLNQHTSFPRGIPYDYSFDFENLKMDLIEYLYYSNDIA